jgi:hypothetical protein
MGSIHRPMPRGSQTVMNSGPTTTALDRTELGSRLIIERLTAGELDPTLARFVWEATAGIPPHTIKDDETFDVADRLGLVQGWQGRIRVSQPVEFSLYPATHRHCTGPR